MTWRWACQCGLSWPSSATPSWASSYSSFLESSTRPAKCLRSRRMCQWPRSPSRRRPSRNACWQRPDDRRIRCSARYQICPFFSPNPTTPFCFCLTLFVWFAELAEPSGVARPTTISSSNPLICAVCCTTVHLPTCLLCSTRADHNSLLYSPSHSLSHLSKWDKKSKNCIVTMETKGKNCPLMCSMHRYPGPFPRIRKLWHNFHQPYLHDRLKQEWKKTYIKVPLYCCMNACNSIFTVAQGNKWTLWTHCCFDWREPSASVWCDCCMMGYSSDNRMHVSSKALQIVSVYNRAFYKL